MNMYELIPIPIYDYVSVYPGVNSETQFIRPDCCCCRLSDEVAAGCVGHSVTS